MNFPFKPVGKKVVIQIAESKEESGKEDRTYDSKVSFQFHRAYPFRVIAVADDVVCVKPGDIVYCDKERSQSMTYLYNWYNIVEENQIMIKRTDDYDSFPDLKFPECSGDGVYGPMKIGGL